MKMIILAAGEGKRLRPYTNKVPKCLVEVAGRTILDWQIRVANACGIREIIVVRGYKREMVVRNGVIFFDNHRYASTNMVASLWKAESLFEDAFIVSYADIIYEKRILDSLICSKNPINIVVDLDWKEYWERRFENILCDAESLTLDAAGRIASIGQKPKSPEQIHGQYIGLMSFIGDGVRKAREIYENLRHNCESRSTQASAKVNFENLFMTDFLQIIIDSGFPAMSVPVHRGWVEIDSHRDLEVANRSIMHENGELKIK